MEIGRKESDRKSWSERESEEGATVGTTKTTSGPAPKGV